MTRPPATSLNNNKREVGTGLVLGTLEGFALRLMVDERDNGRTEFNGVIESWTLLRYALRFLGTPLCKNFGI
jgi:hypothetical protein